MSGTQPIGDVVHHVIVPEPGDSTTEGETFHGRLASSGFVPTPICVIASLDDEERWAEVFEEQSRAPGQSSRFLVRLVIHGECEHVVALADLPALLAHFDRLGPLVARMATSDASGKGRRTRKLLRAAPDQR